MHAQVWPVFRARGGGVLARTNVTVRDASCGSPVKLSPSLRSVCLRCRYDMMSVAKLLKKKKKWTGPTVPGARASPSVSARGLGGTRALTRFMVREEDLVYDPAHPRPPMALVQSDLRGVLQHLKESEKKSLMPKSPSWIWKQGRYKKCRGKWWSLFLRASLMT